MWQTAIVLAVVVLAAIYVVWRLRRTVTRRETTCCDLGDRGQCPLQTGSGPSDACEGCSSRPD